ncbi:MAG: DUF308 domain-containing protein [Acidimicrobiia bacterium]
MSSSQPFEVDPDVASLWWVLAVSGLLSVAIGALLVFWPGRTLTVVVWLFGALMILTGVVRFILAVFGQTSQIRWLLLVSAIIGVALGIVVIKNPDAVIKLVVVIAGLFWIVGGMIDVFRGVNDDTAPDRGTRIGLGIVSILVGCVVLIWPAPTVLVFAIVAGGYAIAYGILEIYSGFRLRAA